MARFDAAAYWDRRYSEGRTSGIGSEGERATQKARYVNAVVDTYDVTSIVDWGVGDGVVAQQIHVPSYVGVDVSVTVIRRLRIVMPDRTFLLPGYAYGVTADLALSLDVLFHLVDDVSYEQYLRRLFGSATRLVLIHSTDYAGEQTARHVLWRHWSSDVERWFPEWKPERQGNSNRLDWHLYRRP